MVTGFGLQSEALTKVTSRLKVPETKSILVQEARQQFWSFMEGILHKIAFCQGKFENFGFFSLKNLTREQIM